MANLTATHPGALGSTTPPVSPTTGAVSQAPSNLALTQAYEPGSVFKLVTFSAALQDGLINPASPFTVPDQILLDGSTFHDAEPHPTEQLTATQILAQSSNIGTSRDRPDRSARDRLLAQVQHLGFGRPTGLRFPGETPGCWSTAGAVGAHQPRLAPDRPGRRGDRPCRCSTPTTPWPTAACLSSPAWSGAHRVRRPGPGGGTVGDATGCSRRRSTPS